MNTLQINTALKDLPCFNGTYARDMLPEIKKKPFDVIPNTDLSNSPGQRWIAIYFGEDNSAEYFGSYGLPPLHKEFNRYLFSNARNVYYNTSTIQSCSLKSNVCGNYCILFIKFKCAGYSFSQMLSLFSSS